ncbi:small GTPase superfamily [Cantharellus anzutake]|uniref:small GTPase superfamily n=1 Tax=Cantharellus anzutake TaxID=1750568 RepID=UPI001904C45E|nr:small GTPase superfamily [Cantharellus anzutake]KAF8325284.1 small GTPase superfamily [Cantharellus anzutake]
MTSIENIFNKRKIAVLGSRAVGKSSLIIQFTDNVFHPNYFPTIENTFTKQINYKGREYDCDIIDTAGQDEYTPLHSRHSIGVHGYILVYSVTNRVSFEMVKKVHDKIITQSGMANIPCVVVGQKSDLADSRQVPEEEGARLAKELKSAFIETSAKDASHIQDVFDKALDEIEKRALPGSQAPSKESSGCIIM